MVRPLEETQSNDNLIWHQNALKCKTGNTQISINVYGVLGGNVFKV
jgi:hypothetical protein